MQWRVKHPWDGNYAIPKYIMDEPARFQTHTTSYRRRRSIGPLGVRPPGWSPHLAIPDYIKNEPIGQGVFRTKYTPRRSVSTLIPNYLGNYISEMGDSHPEQLLAGGPNDAIARFGEQVSTMIMTRVMELPAPMRKDALKSLFNELDPNLWSIVSRKADKLVKTRDMGPMEALEKAIAASTSFGLLKEILKMGEKRQGPKLKSMAGLAAYGDIAEVVVLDGYMTSMQTLGWCGPICQSKRAGSAIKSAATTVVRKVSGAATTVYGAAGTAGKWVGSTAASAGKWVGSTAASAGKWVGSKAYGAGSAVYGFGKDVINKIASLACTVISSDMGSMAVVAGAAAYGVPPQVGMAGAQIGKQLCNGTPEEAAAQAAVLEEQRRKKFPTLLVVGGGAAALGILYLATRKKARKK